MVVEWFQFLHWRSEGVIPTNMLSDRWLLATEIKPHSFSSSSSPSFPSPLFCPTQHWNAPFKIFFSFSKAQENYRSCDRTHTHNVKTMFLQGCSTRVDASVDWHLSIIINLPGKLPCFYNSWLGIEAKVPYNFPQPLY